MVGTDEKRILEMFEFFCGSNFSVKGSLLYGNGNSREVIVRELVHYEEKYMDY